jgi:hypothetical protein
MFSLLSVPETHAPVGTRHIMKPKTMYNTENKNMDYIETKRMRKVD